MCFIILVRLEREIMQKVFLFSIFIFAALAVEGQQVGVLRLVVQNKDTKSAVSDAEVSVKGTALTGRTNAAGKAELRDIPAGEQTVEVFSPGYERIEIKLVFPLADASERIVM